MCSNCTIGYSSRERATICALCTAGKYSSSDSLDLVFMCVDCPEDTYSGTVCFITVGATNASVCVPCTAGKYSQKGAVAASACESCGFYPNCAPGCYMVEVFERNDFYVVLFICKFYITCPIQRDAVGAV